MVNRIEERGNPVLVIAMGIGGGRFLGIRGGGRAHTKAEGSACLTYPETKEVIGLLV